MVSGEPFTCYPFPVNLAMFNENIPVILVEPETHIKANFNTNGVLFQTYIAFFTIFLAWLSLCFSPEKICWDLKDNCKYSKDTSILMTAGMNYVPFWDSNNIFCQDFLNVPYL